MTPSQVVQERVTAHPSDELTYQWHDFRGAGQLLSGKASDPRRMGKDRPLSSNSELHREERRSHQTDSTAKF
jgi:hypothetical protein